MALGCRHLSAALESMHRKLSKFHTHTQAGNLLYVCFCFFYFVINRNQYQKLKESLNGDSRVDSGILDP